MTEVGGDVRPRREPAVVPSDEPGRNSVPGDQHPAAVVLDRGAAPPPWTRRAGPVCQGSGAHWYYAKLLPAGLAVPQVKSIDSASPHAARYFVAADGPGLAAVGTDGAQQPQLPGCGCACRHRHLGCPNASVTSAAPGRMSASIPLGSWSRFESSILAHARHL